MEYDLFISYRTEDQNFAKKVASYIESYEYAGRKFKVFLYQWDIRPGENVVTKIEEGLSKSRYVVLVLSPAYFEGDWTVAEKNAAIFSDPSGRLKRLIPLLHKTCNLPPLLAPRSYIDLTSDKNFKNGMAKVLSILKDENLPRGTQNILKNDFSIPLLPNTLDGPDIIQEILYSNLLQISKFPNYIWSAPTKFNTQESLREYYGKNYIPPNVIHGRRLYCFCDLSKKDNPFVGVIEDYDLKKENWIEWVDDPVKSKHLIWLFNDCIRAHAHKFRLSYDSNGKKYYYRQGTLEDNSFKAFTKGRGRKLIISYPDARGGLGYFAHRAVKLQFILMRDSPLLRIETGWVFSYDGYHPIEGKKRSVLNTRFMSNQKNISNLTEIRYWVWFLSNENSKMSLDIGGDTIDLETNLLTCESPIGISGDYIKQSSVTSPPEITFREYEGEEIDLESELTEGVDLDE
ncbi:MAG: toll/interleukin-1 receptor domain-containing protein [Candidatus Pacearchaeota archaeon]